MPKAAILFTMSSWTHSYIGNLAILTEYSGQIEVLFILSITRSFAFEVKILFAAYK